MELKEAFQGFLRSRADLTLSDRLSLSAAIRSPEELSAMMAYLAEKPEATADELFQKAGEIAFGPK